MTYECSHCGQKARRVRGDYRFDESGLPNVILRNIEIIACRKCGNRDPVLHRAAKLLRTLADAVVHKPFRLTGEEFRFLRKRLGLTADHLGRIMHVDKTTISKWENNALTIGEQSDLLIRTLALAARAETKGREALLDHFERIASPLQPNVELLISPDREFAYHYAQQS